MKTASEFAHELNVANEGSWFKLAEDQEHWEAAGVKTADDLDRYLAITSYSDTYKDINGIRPRWVNWDGVATEEIKKQLQALYVDEEEQLQREEDERQADAKRGNPVETENGTVWTF